MTTSSFVASAPHYHGFETFSDENGGASTVPDDLFPHPRTMRSDCEGRFPWKCKKSALAVAPTSSGRAATGRRRAKHVNFVAVGTARDPNSIPDPHLRPSVLPIRLRGGGTEGLNSRHGGKWAFPGHKSSTDASATDAAAGMKLTTLHVHVEDEPPPLSDD